jgi:hypothetical protein
MVDAPMEGEEERELLIDGGWMGASYIESDPADLIRGPSRSEIPEIEVDE